MNAETATEEMELASYELAEAERMERSASKLRTSAVRRVAMVHLYFKEGVKNEKLKTARQKNMLISESPKNETKTMNADMTRPEAQSQLATIYNPLTKMKSDQKCSSGSSTVPCSPS